MNQSEYPVVPGHGQLHFLITGILCLWFASLQAQQFFTRTYTVVNGLPSSVVQDVTQDSSGAIWCATRKGISSYNGYAWTTYSNIGDQPGYGYDFIRCDEKGTLWTVSNFNRAEVHFFRENRWETFNTNRNFTYSKGFVGFEVYHHNGAPVIVIATADSGIFIFSGGKWKNLTVKEGMTGRYIHKITLLNKKIFVATNNGMTVIRDEKPEPLLAWKPPYDSREIVCIYAKPGRESGSGLPLLWLMGHNWIGKLEEGHFTDYSRDFLLQTNEEQMFGLISPDGNDGIFFGNYLTLYYYSYLTGKTEILSQKNGMVGDGAFAILTDRESNTWIAGKMGLTCIPASRFTNLTSLHGLKEDDVTSALELRPGECVFAHNGVLTFFKDHKASYLSLVREGMLQAHEIRIQDMQVDLKGDLWVAASKLGLARIDAARNITWYRNTEGLPGRIVSVTENADGVIYASNVEGMYRFTGSRFEKVPLQWVEGIRKIVSFNGKLFLLTYESGLVEYNGRQLIRYNSKLNPQANSIFSFLRDSKGRTWVGTAGGIYTIENNALVKSPVIPPSEIDHPVYLILEDRIGCIWFGADNGLYRWNGSMMNHFTVRDGVSGPDINRDAGFIDHQNFIWFGSNNGLTKIGGDFDHRIAKIPPPKITLERLIVSSDTFNLTRDVTLSSHQHDLEFFFSGFSFLDEQRMTYQCKLVSADKDWSPEMSFSTRSFRYNKLAPGSYRFMVRVKNALGTWSEPVISGLIRIKYPYYMQWWFILIMVAFLFFLGLIIFRFILSTRYNAILEETVTQRTKELMESGRQLKLSNQSKDRFFSIIAHDLRNPFNTLLGYLDLLTDKSFDFTESEKEDILDKLKRSAVRTLTLLDNLLSWARTQRGDIKADPDLIDLADIVKENLMLAESAAAEKNIHVVNHVHETCMAFADKNMVHTIIRNLISNAIKFTYNGGRIAISCHRTEKTVQICVDDTGCGIPAETIQKLFSMEDHVATQGTNKEPGTGLGLILCKEFAVLNKGSIFVESTEGKGSRFCVTLPSE